MSDLTYLHRRYRKELESIEQAQGAQARRAHQELARLYAIRIDMLNLMTFRNPAKWGAARASWDG